MLQRERRDTDVVVCDCRSSLHTSCHLVISHMETLRKTVSRPIN